MIRVYESLDFLNLSQVLEYLESLDCPNLTETLLVQLINQGKIPCYVDLSGRTGLLEPVDEASGTEQVTGVGLQLLHGARLASHPGKPGYTLKGIFKGSVRLSGTSFEPAMRCWAPDLTEDAYLPHTASNDHLEEMYEIEKEYEMFSIPIPAGVTPLDRDSIFDFDSFCMKPSDVKEFLGLTKPLGSGVSTHDEKPAISALLMIAYLRDLLFEAYACEKKVPKRINQTMLAYGLEEKYKVSTSSTEKLFMNANKAVKDKLKE